MKRRMLGVAMALACAATIAAAMVALMPSARADSLTWRMKSNYPYAVSVSFYSGDARYAWPGGDNTWVIRDYAVHYYRLNCTRGEKICYGAWVRGNSNLYWGVGRGGRNGCTGCCYRCFGQTTPLRTLH